MRRVVLAVATIGLAAATTGQATAGLLVDTNSSTFNAAGTIVYNSNFNDFGSGFSFPGDPFTRGGVTYTSDQNLVTGTSTIYDPIVNLMTNNYWSPVSGTVDSSAQYNMFGFNLGVLDRQDQIQIEVDTNQNSYILPYQQYANGTQSLSFLGFLTTAPGEYITAFILTTQYGSGSLPGVTNVEVGYQGAVPEPASIVSGSIAILVGLGYSFARRKRPSK
jgi:hypothetical protein